MDNNSNPQIIITGHPTLPTQRPPKPHASIRYNEYDLTGSFEEIKKIS